jgi:Domain of unknown function (DUF6894)
VDGRNKSGHDEVLLCGSPLRLRAIPYGHHLNFSQASGGLSLRAIDDARKADAMAQVYFHCSSAEKVLLNHAAAEVADLTEAREEAHQVVRAFIAGAGPEAWHDWMLHASDDLGEVLFSLPFSIVLGPVH